MIKVKNLEDVTEIYVTGIIEDDAWKESWYESEDTYPSDIRDLLKDAKDEVKVYINSGGGDMFAGVAISNMLKRFKGKTTAIIDGLAASAASIIAFGCDDIEIPKNAYLMIHKPASACWGDSDDFLKMAGTLDTLQKGLVETYLSKAKDGIDEETINAYINAETWFTGKDAGDVFDITIKDEMLVSNIARPGRVYNKEKMPACLVEKKKTDSKENEKEIETMNKELEIALNLI
ncbi:head maturation protease, ClpP-related [uncultured Anaerococcus sp.]|uniref:head maturation protease, ClpP-related n=1 Tax=uncultured Anaerococcus sp. TaxID=293428 RepID=UPI002804DD35|nr:head maturation protease, ClpP-related [uncultured Anaerococcus sp.]